MAGQREHRAGNRQVRTSVDNLDAHLLLFLLRASGCLFQGINLSICELLGHRAAGECLVGVVFAEPGDTQTGRRAFDLKRAVNFWEEHKEADTCLLTKKST